MDKYVQIIYTTALYNQPNLIMKYKLGNFETKRLDLNTIKSVFLRPKKMHEYGSICTVCLAAN